MSKVHPTAIISPAAHLAEDVSIGPFTVIDGPVQLAAGVRVAGHCHISGDVRVGEGCVIGWGSLIGCDPQDLGFDPATPSGVVLGPHNTLREYVTIHRSTKSGASTVLGARNFLMTGAHVAHDVVIGDDNVIANNVLFGGHVTMGDRGFLGGGAAFHQFIKIGDMAMVRGNAAISQDVPPFCMVHSCNVLGGLNVIGLRRASFDAASRKEIKRMFDLLFRSDLPLTAAIAEARTRTWSAPALKLLDACAAPSRKGILTR